jgi:hypothetical protein
MRRNRENIEVGLLREKAKSTPQYHSPAPQCAPHTEEASEASQPLSTHPIHTKMYEMDGSLVFLAKGVN